MQLKEIEKFENKLAKIKNPRARRGLIQSFHTQLIKGEIYNLNAITIEKIVAIELKYGFISHAKKLIYHSHYEKDSKNIDQYYLSDANSLTIKLKLAKKTKQNILYGISPSRLADTFGYLASRNDVFRFKKLADAYVDWVIGRESNNPEENLIEAILNLESLCRYCDHGLFHEDKTRPVKKTQSFFQNNYLTNY